VAGESPTFLAAEELLHLMLAHSTGGEAPPAEYKRCRKVLLDDPAAGDYLPRFVRTCRDPVTRTDKVERPTSRQRVTLRSR
jgi:hypothetical protein